MLGATVFILALLKASADGRIEVEEDDGEYLS
jgi:hypothetical protein